MVPSPVPMVVVVVEVEEVSFPRARAMRALSIIEYVEVKVYQLFRYGLNSYDQGGMINEAWIESSRYKDRVSRYGLNVRSSQGTNGLSRHGE